MTLSLRHKTTGMKATNSSRNEEIVCIQDSFNKCLLQKIEHVIIAEDTEKASLLIQTYENYKKLDLSDDWADEIEILHYLKAKNFVKKGNYTQAISEINKAIEINEKSDTELAAIYATDHYNLKGQIEHLLGDDNNAVKSFTIVQESPACCFKLKREMEKIIIGLERE